MLSLSYFCTLRLKTCVSKYTTLWFCVHSYLSENIFTAAIKDEALLIKSHVVSSAIDGAGSITLAGSALPLPVFTSAVNGYALDNIMLTIKDHLLCLSISVTD